MSCAICYLDFEPEGLTRAILPCCDRKDSTLQFCTECIHLLCQRSRRIHQIVECPRCKKYIQVREDGKIINVDEAPINCAMCRMTRLPSQEHASLCSACYSGIRNPLRYECNTCHRIQRIPHPMYRYQENPFSFGSSSWACHQGCHTYTMWRIIPEDISKVPMEDAPDGWRLRELEYEEIRLIRRDNAAAGDRGANGNGLMDRPRLSICTLM